MMRSIASATLIVVLATAGGYQPSSAAAAGKPELVYRSNGASISAPAVSGSNVARVAGRRGRPGKCVTGRKRLQVLRPNGKARTLSARKGRNYETTCVYRPTVAGAFVLWATPGRQLIWERGEGWVRRWRAGCGQDLAWHHDSTRDVNLHVFTRRSQRAWPRWIGADQQETRIWVETDRQTGQMRLPGSGLSLQLPESFDGLDAAGESIVIRVKEASGYGLVSVNRATGALTTIVSGVQRLSLPAVANGHAAYLRRDGKIERVELIDVDTGEVTLLASRQGKAAWGRGQIVTGRPLDCDGARVVFSSGRQVFALSAER
jgi:hypothetical protein